ncbi:MAG: rod shape-determining protein MreC [Oligoflexia bacterium]|nr:rod shape-determining protein MreC [Oligoflexia bacterium]
MFGFFDFDFKKFLIVVLILALPLISLNLERRDNESETKWYQKPILWVVHPTQKAFTDFSQGVARTTSEYLNLIDIKKENRILKEELATIKQSLSEREELKLENDRLRKMLEFGHDVSHQMLAAQVTAVDLFSSEYSSLKINKGTNNGIKKWMAVITHEGVVGYVLNTTAEYSTILALTDRNAVIDAIVQRTRARGISEGVGRDLSRLKYLNRTDDVEMGDLIVTSGLDGLFPKGFPLGIVSKVSKKAFGVTQDVEFRPSVDINRVEEVFVVLTPKNPLTTPTPSPTTQPSPGAKAKQ